MRGEHPGLGAARWCSGESPGFYLLISFLVPFALYLRTVWFDFAWDDWDLIAHVARLYDSGGVSGVLSGEFNLGTAHAHGYYRPVVLASFLAEKLFFDASAPHAHFVNVLIHAINCVLVFLVSSRVLNNRGASLFGALLFAVHPVHVESVAFVSGRTDLFAALWGLVALAAFLSERLQRHGVIYLAAIGAGSFLAPLSKEVGVVFPALIITVSLLGVRGKKAEGLRSSAAPALAAVAALCLAGLLRYVCLEGVETSFFESARSPGIQLRALATYLVNLVFPFSLRVFYPAETLLHGIYSLLVAGLLSAGFFLAGLHRRRGAKAGALLLAASLLPMVLFSVKGAPVADRNLYLPSIAFCFLVSSAVSAVRTEGRARILSALSLLVVFGGISWAQAGKWKNDVVLFENLTSDAPTASVGYLNLGEAYMRYDRHGEALSVYKKAVEIFPGEAQFHYGMANAKRMSGDLAGAIGDYSRAIKLNPEFKSAYLNLGGVKYRVGKPREAADLFRKAVELAPGDLVARKNLGIVAASVGNLGEARSSFMFVAGRKPADVDVRRRLEKVCGELVAVGSFASVEACVGRDSSDE